MNIASKYPNISEWLGHWLVQLCARLDDEYVALAFELAREKQYHQHNLALLDQHLGAAAQICRDFDRLIGEKKRLPTDLDEANRVVLDKLAEIRAIFGLHRLGFTRICFVGSPDLIASYHTTNFAIEITRLSASTGKRADVWDYKLSSLPAGMQGGIMSSSGKPSELSKLENALFEAIYREIETKGPQLRKVGNTKGAILWVSLGRDYFATECELPGVGVQTMMMAPQKALQEAFDAIKKTKVYRSLCHVVLSRGRDKDDLVYSPLKDGRCTP